MRTSDNQANPNESRWAKLQRDFRLLVQLAAMTVYYWTRGSRMRASYRRCVDRDEIYYVDDDPADAERRVR